MNNCTTKLNATENDKYVDIELGWLGLTTMSKVKNGLSHSTCYEFNWRLWSWLKAFTVGKRQDVKPSQVSKSDTMYKFSRFFSTQHDVT